MSTFQTPEPVPADIGGLQHLSPDVMVEPGDVIVEDGVPSFRAYMTAGQSVADFERRNPSCRVYRRIAVPKQGDATKGTTWGRIAAENPFAESVCGIPVAPAPLPTDKAARKAIPIATGFIDYFPRAVAAVAELSRIGNDQHNPGKPLHWDRSKSGDESDALMRHFLERDKVDTDGVLHAAKVAWRAMAFLEKKLEAIDQESRAKK